MPSMTAHIDRRGFLASLSALALAPRLAGQAARPQIKARGINHVNLTVSDLKHSVDFYQGLFGMPVQARSGTTGVQLGVGSGPLHLALSSGEAGAPAGIDHYCLSVDGFNVDGIMRTLAEHGVTKSEQRGAMRVQVTMRGADTPQVYVGDPDGIVLQLQDVSYCAGGTGPLGSRCPTPEASAKRGLIALKGYSHLTIFSSDSQRSNAFYRGLFGMGIRSYQGPTAPTLAVGPGVEFLMFTGGAGGVVGGSPATAQRRASINHFCFNLENFKPDDLLKTLESYGIKPREGAGPAGPMRHYISMRMENRGGAKDGTPELYFTDPDGILVQLQDVKYCGGSGVLGDACPAV
jgi:catechol 2,3-dioxygenase-like lactoylglutathione lyase family enzyme